MCLDPGTLAVAGAAASGLSRAASSVFGGVSARNAANAQAALAEANAAEADRQAAEAMLRGSDEAAAAYLSGGQLAGRLAASAAANGVELGFGSPLEVIGGAAQMGEMDAQAARQTASGDAEALRRKALAYLLRAGAARARGRASLASGLIGGAGTLLGTASQISRAPSGLIAG
jgi:hypothetical protein